MKDLNFVLGNEFNVAVSVRAPDGDDNVQVWDIPPGGQFPCKNRLATLDIIVKVDMEVFPRGKAQAGILIPRLGTLIADGHLPNCLTQASTVSLWSAGRQK